jgi:hypothetical protein
MSEAPRRGAANRSFPRRSTSMGADAAKVVSLGPVPVPACCRGPVSRLRRSPWCAHLLARSKLSIRITDGVPGP